MEKERKPDIKELSLELATLNMTINDMAQILEWGEIRIQIQNKRVTCIKCETTFKI